MVSFWLGAGQPDMPIPQRAELAAHLLDAADAALRQGGNPEEHHPTAVAIGLRFPQTLKGCKQQAGRIRKPLWIFFRILGEFMRADTQELESLMNSLKMTVAACPRIERLGLDARLGNMKDFRDLTGGKARRQMRWNRDCAPVALKMIDEASKRHEVADMRSVARFGKRKGIA